MISSLSSLIELFSAVHLTICLDDLLFKRFWTPDYRKEFEKSIDSILLPQIAKRYVFDKVNALSESEISRSRKRGALLFAYGVILLIIAGFFDYLLESTQLLLYYMIIIFSIIIALIYCFDVKCLKRGWAILYITVSPWIIFALITYVIYSCSKSQLPFDTNYDIPQLFAKSFIVILLVLPVLWQVFRNWLYTVYYKKYVVTSIESKAKEYLFALDFDPQKKHRMTDVAIPYQNEVATKLVQQTDDRVITSFISILQEELTSIEYIPDAFSLIKYYFVDKRFNYPSKRRLKLLLRKYNNKSPKIKIEKFCDLEKINSEIFKDYYNKN